MKRVLLAVTGTVAGLVALLSFKTHGNGIHAAALPSAGLRPTTNATSNAAGTRSAVGKAQQTRYGVVQVKVTVRGSTITDVSFVQLTGTDPRSDEINSQAGPILLQETLKAQSAKIDGVSGATFTSQGYVASLQSALDQL